ncbi:hypothetical protein G9P44_003777 [Scheffersomyces stipitis]|nr:hypothetical protein G9P44_003777 [Scheffersomyces stipitis]
MDDPIRAGYQECYAFRDEIEMIYEQSMDRSEAGISHIARWNVSVKSDWRVLIVEVAAEPQIRNGQS